MKKLHLLKLLDVQHVRDGKVLWEAHDLENTFHTFGELFMLQCCFVNDGSFPPSSYYLGLDNRPAIDVADQMTDLVDEPNGSGYLRQSVSSVDGFSIQVVNDVHRAITGIVTFTATGSGWGPVNTLFLTDRNDNDGTLIASVSLSNTITPDNGDAINMRMALALHDTDD